MSVSITSKLNKPANEFAAGESVGFGLRLGQQYFDPKTKTKDWTNYQAVIFAKAPAQIEFYRQNLVEGAVVAVSGKEQKIDVYDGANGQVITIEILNASLDNVFNLGGQAPQKPAQPAPTQQGGFNQAPAPQAKPQSFGSFGAAPSPAPAPVATWEGVTIIGDAAAKGATIEQIKAHPDVVGDVQKAISLGYVEDLSIPF